MKKYLLHLILLIGIILFESCNSGPKYHKPDEIFRYLFIKSNKVTNIEIAKDFTPMQEKIQKFVLPTDIYLDTSKSPYVVKHYNELLESDSAILSIYNKALELSSNYEYTKCRTNLFDVLFLISKFINSHGTNWRIIPL